MEKINFPNPTRIALEDDGFSIPPIYALRCKDMDADVGYRMQTKFIPVGELVADGSDGYGTIDGKSLGTKDLMNVLSVYSDFLLLRHNLQNFDLSDFVISPGLYVPVPGRVYDNTKRYTLYYLEKL